MSRFDSRKIALGIFAVWVLGSAINLVLFHVDQWRRGPRASDCASTDAKPFSVATRKLECP